MRLRLVAVVVGVVAVAGACGGRSREERPGSGTAAGGAGGTGGSGVGGSGTGGTGVGGSGTGGTGVGGSGTGGTGVGGTGATGGGAGGSAGAGAHAGQPSQGGAAGNPSLPECSLGVHLDRCCPVPEPVTREELAADPCLAPWDPGAPLPTRMGCGDDCAVDCTAGDPETRVVEPDEAGGCRFASECEADDDCVLLWDAWYCCACPSWSLPRSFAGQYCFVEPGKPAPPGCAACPNGTLCTCPATAPPSCVRTPSKLGRCVSVRSNVPAGRCAAERQCAADATGVPCAICVVPGDAACGGPAPPPATCTTDADCSAQAANLICAAAPCRNPECIPGCSADMDCALGELCGGDHRCSPAPCQTESDCNANRTCADGHCVRRPCTVSSDCGDYCVNNTCYEDPGTCADGCIP